MKKLFTFNLKQRLYIINVGEEEQSLVLAFFHRNSEMEFMEISRWKKRFLLAVLEATNEEM